MLQVHVDEPSALVDPAVHDEHDEEPAVALYVFAAQAEKRQRAELGNKEKRAGAAMLRLNQWWRKGTATARALGAYRRSCRRTRCSSRWRRLHGNRVRGRAEGPGLHA